MRRKSNTLQRHYRTAAPRHEELLATFREQMADVTRGQKLKGLREKAHKSQETVAYEVGVSVRTIRAWEQGGAIKWANAKRLGEFFDVDPNTLVDREGAEGAGPSPEAIGESEQLHALEGKIDLLAAQVQKLQAQQTKLLSELAREKRTRPSPQRRKKQNG